MLCDEDCVTIVAELAEHAASRAAATCKAVDVGVFEIQYLRSMYSGSRCPNSKQHPWLLGWQGRQQAQACFLLSEQEQKEQFTTSCVYVIDLSSHGKPNPLLGWELTAHADL